jgi:hypothetical protein
MNKPLARVFISIVEFYILFTFYIVSPLFA